MKPLHEKKVKELCVSHEFENLYGDVTGEITSGLIHYSTLKQWAIAVVKEIRNPSGQDGSGYGITFIEPGKKEPTIWSEEVAQFLIETVPLTEEDLK